MATETDINQFKRQLANLEQEVVELSQALELGVAEYFRKVLERMIEVLGVGGGVWHIRDDGAFETVCFMNLSAAGVEEEGSQRRLLLGALGQVQRTGTAVVLPGKGGSDLFNGGMGEQAMNESPHTLLFVPVLRGSSLWGILLLISPADVDPRAVRGYLGFVMGLCERAGSYLRGKQIQDLEGQLQRSERFREYVSAVHSSLDPKRSCYALANYGQEMLGVFRCMAGTYNSRGKFRMEAVSGLESVAVKSSFVQRIGRVARQVCRNDKALVVDNPDAVRNQDVPGDDLVNEARLYMLEAESLVMGIFPIRHEGHVVGALVVEKANEEGFYEKQRKQIEGLLSEAGIALENGLTYRQMPLSWVTGGLGKLRDRIYRTPRSRQWFWGSVAAMVILLPFVIRKEIKVVGAAELIPQEARIAYAQQDGKIETIMIPPNRQVVKGQVLAKLDTRLIDSEIDRVTNSIAETTIERDQAVNNRQMTQAQRLDSTLKAMKAELKKYELMREEYSICAPVAGQVITRESQIRLLASKPVSRGEAVLEIVPQECTWNLLVNVPEGVSEDLLRAYDDKERKEPLKAKVILNAYPDQIFETEVISITPRAVVDMTQKDEYRNAIEVKVAEPAGFVKEVGQPRQGMEGKVSIECGKRSLFYAVTHEFANFIRISLF